MKSVVPTWQELERIAKLGDEAAQHGDDAQRDMCDVALGTKSDPRWSRQRAIRGCLDVIARAKVTP